MPSDAPVTVSALIISKNAEFLESAISSFEDSCRTAGYRYEVSVSWNGQENAIFPKIQHLQKVSYHYSTNINQLANMATGKYVLLLNDDIICDPNSVTELIRPLIENDSIAITGAKLRFPNGKIQHVGVMLDGENKPYHPYKGKIESELDVAIVDRFVPAVTGAMLATYRELLIQHPMDTSFDTAAQDVAFCLSVQNSGRGMVYFASRATAIHMEGGTRNPTKTNGTPDSDMKRLTSVYISRFLQDLYRPKVDIITEEKGWILHRKAQEIKKYSFFLDVEINKPRSDCDIVYFINYGYYKPKYKSKITVANFTHYDPTNLARRFEAVSREVDQLTSISNSTTKTLENLGVDPDKIATILVGSDVSFRPKLILGLVGRIYKGGRKGEHLVKKLENDPELSQKICIVSTNDDWGVPALEVERQDFYNMIDFLLVPSLIEGGPVPYMEALSAGTLAVAPEVGVVPDFPHVSYETGDYTSLKATLIRLHEEKLTSRERIASTIRPYNWQSWASEHEKLFIRLSKEHPEIKL